MKPAPQQPRSADDEHEGYCHHPDAPDGAECDLECNYYDDETDATPEEDCRWHREQPREGVR